MFWNISKFAETLVPLIDSDKKKAIKKVSRSNFWSQTSD